MEKRGQVGVFVIVGAVVLAAFVLLFFFQDNLRELRQQQSPQEFLELRLASFEDDLKDCVSQSYQKEVSLFLEQGGVFDPVRYLEYQGRKVTFLCQSLEGGSCLSSPLVYSHVEQYFAERIEVSVLSCLHLDAYQEEEYSFVQEGNLSVALDLSHVGSSFLVSYPITFSRQELSVSSEPLSLFDPFPLRSYLDIVNDLLRQEALGDPVDPLIENLLSLGHFTLEIKNPYPDKVYIVSLPAYPEKHFWFAVEGEGRYERYEAPFLAE